MPSTTDRGYGWTHQDRREELLPAAIDQPCPFCHFEMKLGQALDLDHSDPESRKRLEPGDRIVHASCNRAGKAHYGEPTPAVRYCEICGTLFASREKATRTCSRACGVELWRRNRPITTPKPKPPTVERTCTECTQPFETRYPHKKTCSKRCSRKRMSRWQASNDGQPIEPWTCRQCGQRIPTTGKPGRPKVFCVECRRPNEYQPIT